MLVRDVSELARWTNDAPRTVVVGAGAVGLYIATELARRGQTVVVVEAGGLALGNFDPGSFVSVGRRHEGIAVGRSRTLGGTSNLWGGQLAEYQEIDLAGRDWLPGSTWPVAYGELRDLYRRAYSTLGFPTTTHSDDDVWRSLGMNAPQLGAGLEVFLTRWLNVPNFAVRADASIRESPRLLVLVEHAARGFRGDGARATAVTVVSRDGGQHELPAESVVLATGTIETSRLLLHAAEESGWPAPWSHNPQVGSRFQDHLGGRIAKVHPIDAKRFYAAFSNAVLGGRKYQPKFQFDSDTRSRERVVNVHGMFRFESSVSENLIYLKQFAKAAIYGRKLGGFRELLPNIRASARYLPPIMWTYVKDHRIFEPRSSRISLVVQMEQIPRDESRIRTDRASCDAFGLPQVVLDWKVDGEEIESLREFALRADRALRAAGLASLEIDEGLLRGDPEYLSALRDTNHASGGAIMARTRAEGVVDERLRVFGADNVYIGGSATFPTIGAANTTFTALALGLGLADRLAASNDA
jgi:choline dehydrogenase-like flavoprotein